MRCLVLASLLFAACTKDDPPVQDPLDYLRVGVDPREESQAIIEDLQRAGYRIGRRFDEPVYIAFDAARGADASVRVVSSRGVVLSLQAPDVRWPERLWVELASGSRPDFDGDGQRDVVVSIRERDRTCLGWAQIDLQGFASEPFRPKVKWGEAPCVIRIDPSSRGLLLEVGVPGAGKADARVRFPLRADAADWVPDDSPAAREQWEGAVATRLSELEAAEIRGDGATAARIRAELEWLDQLRNEEARMLEAADDGEEAR